MAINNKLKSAATYGVILVLGLAGGYAASLLPALLKPSHVEGNYAAYFPDAKTKVVLYGTAWCGFCAKTREHFKANNIAFVDLDIEKSPLAATQHQALGGGGVPVVLVGNRKIVGFDPSALDEAIKLTR